MKVPSRTKVGADCRSWVWLIYAAAVIAIVVLMWRVRKPRMQEALTASPPLASTSGPMFTRTVENKTEAPREAPPGMVWIPGGEFSMGAQDAPGMTEVGMQATRDSRPIHRVYVDGFFMDRTDVTNAEFSKFVKATGYVTVAERKPRAEDFPGDLWLGVQEQGRSDDARRGCRLSSLPSRYSGCERHVNRRQRCSPDP